MKNYLVAILGLLKSYSLAGIVIFVIALLVQFTNYDSWTALAYLAIITVSLVLFAAVSLPLMSLVKNDLEIKRILKSYLLKTQIVSVIFALLYGLLINLSDKNSLSPASIDLIFFAVFCILTFSYAYFGYEFFKRLFNISTANILGFVYLLLLVLLLFYGVSTHWEFGIS